jgi:hypothetical protein
MLKHILSAPSQVDTVVDSATANGVMQGNNCEEWILEALTVMKAFILM